MKKILFYMLLLATGFSQLQVNTIAPNFTLTDAVGIPHTLSDYRGQFVILYFYPKDNTPGCTKEACSFRDNFSQIRAINATILGVSWDSSEKHAAFSEMYNLPFTLLSDINKDVTKAYKAAGWFMPKRYTYVIDPLGKIINVYTEFDLSTHTVEIITFILSISESQTKTIPN